MAEGILSEETINTFREYLVLEEKSTATVEKYLRDVRAFHLFACQQAVTKERMMAYKKYLIERDMQPVQSIPCWRVLTVCWTSKAGQTVRLKTSRPNVRPTARRKKS